MFSVKNWIKGGLDSLLKRIDLRNTIERKKGSGRPVSACTDENVDTVPGLILSKEDQPGTHVFQRKISRRIGTSR